MDPWFEGIDWDAIERGPATNRTYISVSCYTHLMTLTFIRSQARSVQSSLIQMCGGPHGIRLSIRTIGSPLQSRTARPWTNAMPYTTTSCYKWSYTTTTH